MECGFDNPLQDNFHLKALLRGMKRVKGNFSLQKSPISPGHLLLVRTRLNLDDASDSLIWAAILSAFFGLLRVGNVTTNNKNTDNYIKRSDLKVSETGCILNVHKSKTNQFQERTVQIALPYMRGHPLCPTTAVLSFLGKAGDIVFHEPLFAVMHNNKLKHLSQNYFRKSFSALLQSIGLQCDKYNTHSLRRGGATWLMCAGVPLEMIKAIGDWKSDSVFAYLKPDISEKLRVVQMAAAHNLPSK